MDFKGTLNRALCRYARRPRDNQRSRVYSWERAAWRSIPSGVETGPDLSTVQACEAWLAPIWRAERARYGLPGAPAPAVQRPHWGQRRGLAYDYQHRITLPLWARTPWIALHELAHLLTPGSAAHGPRFVGVLIGLLVRHTGRDAEQLLALTDQHGVAVDKTSIGKQPQSAQQHTGAARLLQLLPATDMELALQMDLHWRQVRGLALRLIRQGQVRWLRGKLVPCKASREEPAPGRRA